MSSAFLKNETADAPVVIPARAPLPPGVANYVTPRGLALLRAELADLDTQRAHRQVDTGDETERTRQLALLNGRIGKLNERIGSAKVVDPQEQPHGEVRFGATVTLRSPVGKGKPEERQFVIVGVDEADAAQGRVAFTAPIARAMQGKHVGDPVSMRTQRGETVLVITAIGYSDAPVRP